MSEFSTSAIHHHSIHLSGTPLFRWSLGPWLRHGGRWPPGPWHLAVGTSSTTGGKGEKCRQKCAEKQGFRGSLDASTIFNPFITAFRVQFSQDVFFGGFFVLLCSLHFAMFYLLHWHLGRQERRPWWRLWNIWTLSACDCMHIDVKCDRVCNNVQIWFHDLECHNVHAIVCVIPARSGPKGLKMLSAPQSSEWRCASCRGNACRFRLAFWRYENVLFEDWPLAWQH